MDPALVEQAKSLAVEDRWELVNELWELLEDEDFPITPEVKALLSERLAEVEASPMEGRTLPGVLADWHAKQR